MSEDSAPDKELIVPDSPEDDPSDSGCTSDTIDVDISFRLIIRDTGVGISEENRKKLFQNFSRLEDTAK